MNIPARFCTGDLSDIGVPEPHEPGIGGVLMATGRAAADVRLGHTFGANLMSGFKIWTDEVAPGEGG